MKTIWPKATKWTGIVLFLITSIFFIIQMMETYIGYSSEEYNWLNSEPKTYQSWESLIPYESSYQTRFLIIWGVLLLMSTLLFIGGLIAEQIARKNDE